MPEISIIVPVYKVEAYLDRCVQSVLGQSFSDFELLLIDDGSPDSCPQMCDEWAKKDSRIKVIHKENGGVSSARNAGLDIARGQYIAFCDSDDYLDKEFLNQLYTAAEEKLYDIVACGFHYVMSTGAKKEYHKRAYDVIFRNSTDRQHYLHKKLLRGCDGWAIWCRLFRAELINKNNIRFCTDCNNFAEDMGFVAKCILHSTSIGSVDYCLYNYVWNPVSMMSSSKTVIRLDDMNQVSYYLGKEYSEDMLGEKWKKYRAISHYMIIYNQYEKMFQQERQKDLPKMLKALTKPDWFKKNTVAIFGAYGLLKDYFGKRDAQRMLLFSSYCIHRSWFLYRLTRGLYNKLFGYRQG